MVNVHQTYKGSYLTLGIMDEVYIAKIVKVGSKPEYQLDVLSRSDGEVVVLEYRYSGDFREKRDIKFKYVFTYNNDFVQALKDLLNEAECIPLEVVDDYLPEFVERWAQL